MLTFKRDTFVSKTGWGMVNKQLTLALSICSGIVNGHLDGSIQQLTDAQLFGAYWNLTERGGGDDPFSASLNAEGEERLARSIHALSACQTASELTGFEYQ
jgi:hypothetical protein